MKGSDFHELLITISEDCANLCTLMGVDITSAIDS